jgi:hypothetical protein
MNKWNWKWMMEWNRKKWKENMMINGKMKYVKNLWMNKKSILKKWD